MYCIYCFFLSFFIDLIYYVLCLVNFNYNSSTNKYNCYINGVNLTSSNFQYWEEYHSTSKIISMDTITLGALGPRHEGGVQHFCNNIIVSDFIIYNSVLSTNNITSSKSEARRAIKGNAIKLDNEVLLDENKLIDLTDFKNENVLKISFGKKKHYLIKII